MRLVSKRPVRILDFDVECRPLSWYAGDFNSKEITAIAWAWVDPKKPRRAKGKVEVRLLGDSDTGAANYEWELEQILEEFRAVYCEADIVTGHFIRGFDLPLLNGACLELGLQPLPPKNTLDTKLDLIRFSGHSKSQENLGAMLELRHPKVIMSQADWRDANRLSPVGLAKVRERVVGDVRQHIEMRAELMERGMLQNAGKVWSGGGLAERYHP